MNAVSRRPGFALPLVLWLIVSLAVSAAVATLLARQAIASATNRVALSRSSWQAEGCASEIIAQLEEWIAAPSDPVERWNSLDAAPVSIAYDCGVSFVPAGLRLDVNGASTGGIARALTAAGLDAVAAQALAATIADWIDRDDNTRPDGAEREWYEQAARVPPRNGPIAADEELALIRGAESLTTVETVLGANDDPLVLTRAPAAALAGLPGMTDEAVAAVIAARAESPFPGLPAIATRLGETARLELVQALPELHRLTVAQPALWVLTVSARNTLARVDAHVELRVARDHRRIAIVRKRTWP